MYATSSAFCLLDLISWKQHYSLGQLVSTEYWPTDRPTDWRADKPTDEAAYWIMIIGKTPQFIEDRKWYLATGDARANIRAGKSGDSRADTRGTQKQTHERTKEWTQERTQERKQKRSQSGYKGGHNHQSWVKRIHMNLSHGGWLSRGSDFTYR